METKKMGKKVEDIDAARRERVKMGSVITLGSEK